MRVLFAGVLLCMVSVGSQAAVSDYGRSVNINAASSGQARPPGWYSQPRYDWPDAPDGWGRMRDINRLEIGGKTVDIHGVRKFAPGTLAAVARGAARFMGPIGLGLTLADLAFDGGQFFFPSEGEPDSTLGGLTVVGPVWRTPGAAENSVPSNCDAAIQGVGQSVYGFWAPTRQEVAQRVRDHGPQTLVCPNETRNLHSVTASTDGVVQLVYRITNAFGYHFDQSISVGMSGDVICETGYRITASGRCVSPQGEVATDQQLEDAIYTELVARGMGSELARRLIEAGYRPEVDGHEVDGPSEVPGDTVTSTTTGPAGTTTTTSVTNHQLSYNTNVTTNTSTVTVTTTITSTVTAPDGSSTTTTTTQQPSEGETVPPEEPKPFCELYPTASACAELGETHDEELAEEERTLAFSWNSAAGSCPAPRSLTLGGTQQEFSFQPMCDFFSALRPLVIAVSLLMAGVFLVQVGRQQ